MQELLDFATTHAVGLSVAALVLMYVGVSLAAMPVPKNRTAYALWWFVRWAAFLTHETFGGKLKVPFTPPVVESPGPFSPPSGDA